MTRQKTKAERAMALRLAAVDTATRGAGAEGSARARRAGGSDLSSGLRLGDGIDVVDGKMQVPLGEGLSLDRDGRIGLSAARDIMVAHIPRFTLPVAYAVFPLSSATSQSFGGGRILIDTDNHWFALEPGAVYLLESSVFLYRNQANTGAPENARVKVQRVDDLLAASPLYTDAMEAPTVQLKSANQADPGVTVGIRAIMDLRGSPAPAAFVFAGKSSNDNGDPEYAEWTSVKIERIG